MASRLYSRHGGTEDAVFDDITSISPFFDDGASLIDLGMSCQNGAASQGRFVLTDPDANVDLSIHMPNRTLIRWTEDAAGCEYWLAQGRLSGADVGRGDVLGADFVERDVTVDDANVDLRGNAFTEDWVRPEETDTDRLYALQAYILAGSSSTSPTFRPSTRITVADSHLAPDANTVTMPAKTYPAGTQPQEVVDDCSTTAGKTYGVVIHHGSGEGVPETLIKFFTADGGDALTWTGATISTGGAEGSTHYYFKSNSPANFQFSWACSPGTMRITGYTHMQAAEGLRVAFRDDPPGSDGGISDGDPVILGIEELVAGPTSAWTAFDSGDLTVPPGTTSASLGRIGSIDFDQIRVYLSTEDESCSHLCLFYTLETDHTTYASTVKISDKIANWDPENLTDPVYEPHWDQGKGLIQSGQAAISGLVSRYGQGTSFLYVNDATKEDDWEHWNDLYADSDSVNATQAAARAAAILEYRKFGDLTGRVSVLVLPEQCHLLTSGMSIQVDTAVILGGQYRGDYEWLRITTNSWEPNIDGRYWAHLQLNRGMRNLPPSRGKLQPAATTPTEAAKLPYDGSTSGLLGGGVGTTQDAIDELADISRVRSWKQPVRVATTVAGTLASSFENGDTVDGVALVTGDRILIKNQAADTANGIYTVNASGAPTRATDMDAADEVVGAGVFVSEGGANGNKVFVCTTNAPITIGVSSILFSEVGASGPITSSALTMATSRLLGRTTASTGAIEEISVGGGLTLSAGTLAATGGGAVIATDTLWDTKGDLAVGTGADTASKLVAGANDTILMAESGEATGLKWVASATPSDQAFGDTAAIGTGDTFTRGDHKHGMPDAPIINTDGDPGKTVYVGVTDPTGSYSPVEGDVWIKRA